MTDIVYRRHTADDREESYRVFRASVFQFVQDIGLVNPDDEDGVEGAWERQGSIMVHLEKTAAEDWVAELDGRIVGWGRSVERGGHLQLTHFFVHPDAQGRGVGNGLLKRVFPDTAASGRSIIATQNPLALSRYLRTGVSVQSVNVEVSREPRRSEPDGDVVLERSELGDDVRKLDQDILGYDRSIDLEFLAEDRPLFVAKRGAETVGYAFGPGEVYNGPIGARDAADLIPIVAQLESVAAEQGHDEFRLSVPLAASGLVRWLLENGYRIDPFYEMLLTDDAMIAFDRYVLTQPNFVW